MEEENQNLTCEMHKQVINMIIMDNKVPFQETLLCPKCLAHKPTISNNLMEITQFLNLMKEKQQQLQGQIESFQTDLENLLQNVIELRNDFLQQADIILEIIKKGISNIQTPSVQEVSKGLLEKIKEMHYNNFELKQSDHLILNQKNLLTKLEPKFSQLLFQKKLTQCQQLLTSIKKYFKSNQIVIPEVLPEPKVNNELIPNVVYDDEQQVSQMCGNINKVEQQEICQVIAFNYTGSLMAAGCRSNIKVWQFDKGNLSEKEILVGHIEDIYCLVFSKKCNWMTSGSKDKTIRCWKEKQNNWVSFQPLKTHSDSVTCLILNKNENELISCSFDQRIIVWKADCENNELIYSYTLQSKHQKGVNSISLNISETALVSCSEDETLILWMLDQNKKWEYKNHIQINNGYRICFISENKLLFQPLKQSITRILELENQQLIIKPNQIINLLQADNDMFLFPTIYNQKKKLIIQKHNKYVYIIQRQKDDTFKIIEHKDCQTQLIYGALTEDGEYLVIWDFSSKNFKVYKIPY